LAVMSPIVICFLTLIAHSVLRCSGSALSAARKFSLSEVGATATTDGMFMKDWIVSCFLRQGHPDTRGEEAYSYATCRAKHSSKPAINVLKLSCVREVPPALSFGSTMSLSTDLGTLHQTAVFAARVQFRHGEPRPLPVESDEDLHDPFVPYLAIVSLAPHADFDLGVIGHVDRGL
jgi:hypothetical protein